MSEQIAFLFPGQGAQSIGMGRDFFDSFRVAREVFEEADERLGFYLSRLIFSGDRAELTATKNSQVAIYVTSLAIQKVIADQMPTLQPVVCSGLSLGEYTALTVAGKLSWDQGLALVRARGEYMEAAGRSCPGTMAVVLGMAVDKIRQVIATSAEKEVWIANLNCPGQVVISGTEKGIARISQALLTHGAKRVLSLAVSGAFHSGLMASAQEKLAPLIHATSLVEETASSIVMNVPGDYVTHSPDQKRYLIEQVVAPVYWEKGIRAMKERGVTRFIEIGCGKTLVGMNRKMGLGSATLHVEKVEDLERLAKVGEKKDEPARSGV